MEIDQLVAELLARGDMNDETVVELNRMVEDWRAGKLDPDDATYIKALHGRIISGAAPEPDDLFAPPATRLDGLTIEEWRDRALRAESELAQIEEASGAR